MTEEFISIDVDLDDVFEFTLAPDNEEAELRIVSLLSGKNKNNEAFLMPFFEVLNDPYCKEFGDYLPLPHAGMSPKEDNKAKRKLRDFSQAFDITLSGTIDIKNDIVGKTGYAILGVGKDQDEEPTNKIKKYVKAE